MAGGKRAGTRRAQTPGGGRLSVLACALAITASVVAWGYLVFIAIEFGTAARSGEPAAWWLLALASLGAVACLFIGLLVAARLLRVLGVSPATTPATGSTSSTGSTPTPAATPGGRRALR